MSYLSYLIEINDRKLQSFTLLNFAHNKNSLDVPDVFNRRLLIPYRILIAYPINYYYF